MFVIDASVGSEDHPKSFSFVPATCKIRILIDLLGYLVSLSGHQNITTPKTSPSSSVLKPIQILMYYLVSGKEFLEFVWQGGDLISHRLRIVEASFQETQPLFNLINKNETILIK